MKKLMAIAVLACLQPLLVQAQTATPIITDSRIKTFVYNENDVFSVLTHYGYQSNIEFGKRETVQTVSVGDRVAWQIVPAGRRLFIKALEEKAHTNMTVVTNKRAYQFDLRSSGRTPLHPSEELVYVVRFFYPQEQKPLPDPAIYSDQMQAPVSMPIPAPAPVAPVGYTAPVARASVRRNFQYSLTGPEAIAPVKIYDDGQATYFRFAKGFNQPIQFYMKGANGQPIAVPVSRNAAGEMIVNAIASSMMIVSGNQRVLVYNEAMPAV